MGWQESIAAAEARILNAVRGLVLDVIDWRAGSLASPDGTADAVQGLPADQAYQSDTRRVQHAGFRSRLAKTVGQVIVKRGTRWFSVAEDDGASVALDDGDAIHYAPGNTASQVKCGNDGSTAIASDAANAKDVAVNGGTLKGAADTDPTLPGTLSLASTGPVLGVYTVTLTYTPPGGAPSVIGSWPTAGAATSGSVTMGGKINVTADRHFKV